MVTVDQLRRSVLIYIGCHAILHSTSPTATNITHRNRSAIGTKLELYQWLWEPTANTEPQSVNKQAIWWPYFSAAQVIRAALKDVPVNNEVQTSALKPTQTLRHRATDWSLDGMLLIADRGITSTG